MVRYCFCLFASPCGPYQNGHGGSGRLRGAAAERHTTCASDLRWIGLIGRKSQIQSLDVDSTLNEPITLMLVV